MRLITILLIIISSKIFSQTIDVNNDFNYSLIRSSILNGDIKTKYSLNFRPVPLEPFNKIITSQYRSIFKSSDNNIEIKSLGIDYLLEFNSHHPYNRNNGTMIPNRGYQHIISPGLYFKIGPLSITFKPEHHFSENKVFDTFWEGHYDEIWRRRYVLWNWIDMPERHGNKQHNKTTFGQSSIKFNLKNFSIGISNENIWWGPSIRNSIMMSNHAQGFKHITFNSIKPLETFIGNFEWQFITGRLENSGFKPTGFDRTFFGDRKLYIPRINENGRTDDWRFLQGYIISYSPKWIDGLSLGFIRWVSMYSDLLEGKYWWIKTPNSYFPVFENIFRGNDQFEDYKGQTNEAAGLFLKWFWEDAKSEFYVEFHYNDAKQNLRDLILDSDHSSAATLGIQKIFKVNNSNILFNWEWTKMEQSASRLVRNAGSWYVHGFTRDGYTNKGEVLGSSIGPGSNSHYLSINRLIKEGLIGFAFEIIEHDNDFYHESFGQDYRRYWKDFNFHIKFNKKFKDFSLSSNIVYIRSLNYQWELDDYAEPYYHPGRDVDNFHLSLKLNYFGNW